MAPQTLLPLQTLENQLAEFLGQPAAPLSELIGTLSNDALPHDLADELKAIAAEADESVGFAFRCGRAYERLDALKLGRAIESLGFVGPDGLPSETLDAPDPDAFARLAAARDRFLRTVSDFTLKFLVVAAILLVAGLSLGLI